MYIGAIVGAGFASGQEILQFFMVYGSQARWQLGLVTLLFSYFGAMVLYLSVRLGAKHYLDLINYLLGRKLARVFDFLSGAMLLSGVGIMLAGSSAIFAEHLFLPGWLGMGLLAVINLSLLWRGLSGILGINAYLVPIKLVAIFTLCLIIWHTHSSSGDLWQYNLSNLASPDRNWFFTSILYVSYNMILVLAVLTTLGQNLSPGKAIWGGVGGGIGLGAAALVLCCTGQKLFPAILNYQIPTIYMAQQVHHWLKYPMGLLIWLAVLTTALANTHGLASRLAPPGAVKYKTAGLIIICLAVPFSILNFDRLVGLIYPAFGYAGLILMVALFLAPLRLALRPLAGKL